LVDAEILPLRGDGSDLIGVAMLFRDATNQIRLETHVESLHRSATEDPLTKVNNRAELNRRLPDFVEQHHVAPAAGSMIICDIDFFKRINDTYGHPAGDEALVLFASILTELCRESDIVARYGGEEFVVLCPDCDLSMAVAKAERIRRELQSRPMPSLKGACISASFGVAQVNPKDDAASLLARADRGLLMAKEGGRNRVVQLAQDEPAEAPPTAGQGWFRWFWFTPGELLLDFDLITPVPQYLAIEKLRGFLGDHKAEILSTDEKRVTVRVDCRNIPGLVRDGERPSMLVVHVDLQEVQLPHERKEKLQAATMLGIEIRAGKMRDRRSRTQLDQAERLRSVLQSYLVAQVIDEATRARIVAP
jgi:diguanylate cyclase (GGDEF)-like protein